MRGGGVMGAFLASPVFRYFIFPVGSAVLGIYVKYVSRNDQFSKFRKEDIAVGLELLRTACLMYVVLTTDRVIALARTNEALADTLVASPIDSAKAAILQSQAQALTNCITMAGWYTAGMFVALWGASTLIRKFGWKSETEMNAVFGVTTPLVLGIIGLALVMVEASK
jgi:hypothetical protein